MNWQLFLCASLITISLSCKKSGGPEKFELTVNPSSITLGPSKDQTEKFTIHATMNWKLTITPAVTWLKASMNEAIEGHYEIVLTALADNFDAERTASITVEATNRTDVPAQTITVKQQSKTGAFSVDKTDMLIAGIANELDSFKITANTGWTISTTATWLTLGTTAGNNNAKIEITNKADFTGTELTGTITVTPALSTIPAHVINVRQGPWARAFGGSGFDEFKSSAQALDGSMVLVGNTESFDGDLSNNHGAGDILVVKTDANGKKLWQKAFGGSGIDKAQSVAIAADGGIIVAGTTRSNNGDVSGNKGNDDAWVLRLDINGSRVWQKTYGGTGWDEGNFVLATADGGFVLTGKTGSTDGDFAGAGNKNLFLMKANSSGVASWTKFYGGANTEEGLHLLSTTDGGYLVSGSVTSVDGDATGNPNTIGKPWIIKTDGNGDLLWQTTINHNKFSLAGAAAKSGTGFLICGYRQTDNTVPGVGITDEDLFVTRVEADGAISWTKLYGGEKVDRATSIVPAHGGGFMIGGFTESVGGDVSGNKGSHDCWMLKINDSGTKLMQKTVGGTRFDQAASIQLAPGNAYWLVGTSSSPGLNTLDNTNYSGVLLKAKE